MLFLAIGGVATYSQSSLNKKRADLEDLNASIRETQRKLDKLQRSERSARKNLSTYSKQRHRISTQIQALRDELSALKDSSMLLQEQMRATTASLDDATRQYNEALRRLYALQVEHQGDVHSSSTVRPLFHSLSESVERHCSELGALKDSLSAQHTLLSKYSQAQSTTLTTTSKQEKELAQNIKRSTQELASIRQDKKAVSAELRKKQQSVARLRSIIAAQVAEAQRKARAEAERERKRRKNAASSAPPASSEPTSGFAANSLPWPTSSRKILHDFGSYRNSQTGATLDNPGIDISAPIGSAVRAVAAGKVSSVTWLPGFGSLVILDHGNGIRTVYANLATVSVGKGATVNAGKNLGTSGENIDGALVHFEVWSGKNRQNPLRYLR